MDAMTFTGYVDHIFDADEYEKRIAVRNYRDATAMKAMKQTKDYPRCLCFSASVKNGCVDQLKDLHVGDKIVVTFYLYGSSGVSKKTQNYWCINKLNVAKKAGIQILERAPHQEESAPDEVPDDIPF